VFRVSQYGGFRKYIKMFVFVKLLGVYLFFLLAMPEVLYAQLQESDYSKLRMEMVKVQIQERGVTDSKVISAMMKVKRHLFVPEKYRKLAYKDGPLEIGEGQTISQPYIVALMTESLHLTGKERILEVGTGSGYQAAILAEICDSVFSIEIKPALANRAKVLLKSSGYKNILLKTGDGYLGWPQKAPFDAIIVTCSPVKIPQPLKDQLKVGGTMIIPVGDLFTQELVLLKKNADGWEIKKIAPVLFVPMINEQGKEY